MDRAMIIKNSECEYEIAVEGRQLKLSFMTSAPIDALVYQDCFIVLLDYTPKDVRDNVWVYDSTGKKLGEIQTPVYAMGNSEPFANLEKHPDGVMISTYDAHKFLIKDAASCKAVEFAKPVAFG